MTSSYTLEGIPTLSYHPTEDSQPAPPPKRHYENCTYIDWPSENQLQPSQEDYNFRKWAVVIGAAVLVGYMASFINLLATFFNDFKKGLCLRKLDSWSLSNPYSTCPADSWKSWSQILFGISNWFSAVFINLPLYLIMSVVMAGCATYISQKAPWIRQSGIPEIKLIVSGLNYNVSQYLGLQTLLYKVAGLVLVVSSGLWLGKEGPLVHVSCCIFNILLEIGVGADCHEALRREILSAATATGIAVAFNAPIGGVLFVLESMPSYFIPTKNMWNSFVTATVAVVSYSGLTAFASGKNFDEKDLFSVEFGNVNWIMLEFIPFVLLGCAGGVYGSFFIDLNIKLGRPRFRNGIRQALVKLTNVSDHYGTVLEMVALVVVTALLSFPFDMTKLSLNAYLIALFTDCPTEISADSKNFICGTNDAATALKLMYFAAIGFFLAAYTFGSDLPGGVLMPSLVIGASTGRWLGIVAQAFQRWLNLDAVCTETSCLVSPSSYAVIGAAAFMTGITKYTMCVVVIMFELSGAVSYVLPIMVAVMASKFSNDWMCKENIYDTWIREVFNRESHIPPEHVNDGRGSGVVNFTTLTTTIKSKLPDLAVSAVMVPVERVECVFLVPDTPYTVESLQSRVDSTIHEGFPVVLSRENPLSLGYVTRSSLSQQLRMMEDSPLTTIVLQVPQLPRAAVGATLHFEKGLGDFSVIKLTVEQPTFVVNDLSPLVLVIDAFEKMSLNYVVVTDSTYHGSDDRMVGFVDRFVLSDLIRTDFAGLHGESRPYISSDYRSQRRSIELLT
ncbi:hypothetical protein DIURU_004531 [Diutina rugosa]|uniref:Chloride channel protein n=1 Tax=Diutina rugosa TaxID=5481 RepID=A0A642UNJ3_DIURU|nr:uncharacterized protein DIURU_004531 [Diutina rugosa]KAA8898687.1 hypothetical protein DIURU_004531 [Diutina rugosa]